MLLTIFTFYVLITSNINITYMSRPTVFAHYRAVAPTLPDNDTGAEALKWDNEVPDRDDDYVAESQRQKARSGVRMAIAALLLGPALVAGAVELSKNIDLNIDWTIPTMKVK